MFQEIPEHSAQAETRQFAYTGKNQQIQVELEDKRVQENRYDADRLRFEMKENEKLLRFAYHKGELYFESSETSQTSYHLGAGIEGFTRDQKTSYLHQDEQLSTALVTDELGAVQNHYLYGAFGEERGSVEQTPNRIRYTGQQYDGVTGQYYLRARFYNPILGRFMQEDVYQGDGLNLYAYCDSNPVMYYDPSGYAKRTRTGGCPPGAQHGGSGTEVDGKANYEGYVKSGDGQPPENFSPEGAGRSGAFREAKRASGIPVSQNPTNVTPAVDKRGDSIPGRDYNFGNGKVIREHYEHIFPDDPTQNRGTHFNDVFGNHYDY